jgi:hypothetical protein
MNPQAIVPNAGHRCKVAAELVASQDTDVFICLRHEEGVHVGQRALAEVSHSVVADVHLSAGQQGQRCGVVVASACCLALCPDYVIEAGAGYVGPPSVCYYL